MVKHDLAEGDTFSIYLRESSWAKAVRDFDDYFIDVDGDDSYSRGERVAQAMRVYTAMHAAAADADDVTDLDDVNPRVLGSVVRNIVQNADDAVDD